VAVAVAVEKHERKQNAVELFLKKVKRELAGHPKPWHRARYEDHPAGLLSSRCTSQSGAS
jgi:hypothetical protein